jgi:predicted alpha-1,2-mannosidase
LAAAAAARVGVASGRKLLGYVDPFMGVDGDGQTVPGAGLPFGFARVSPDTTDPGSKYSTTGYDSNGEILGFSQTHVSGTGGSSKYGNFRMTPLVGELKLEDIHFSKGAEEAAPGYYSVVLARDRIKAELTATRLCGLHRYTFSPTSEAHVLVDATSAIEVDNRAMPTPVSFKQRPVRSEIRVVYPNRVEGSASFEGGWNPGLYTLYFSAEFDRPFTAAGTWVRRECRQKLSAEGGKDEGLGAYATFDVGGDKGTVVQAKIGVSFVSLEKARQNLEREVPHFDFDLIRRKAEAAWEEALSKIHVEGGTEVQRGIFFTGLYRTHFMPHDLTGENVWWAPEDSHYEEYYAIWDTFRTVHPLLTLVQPEHQRDMVQALVETYTHTGWMPDARIAGHNGLTQGGSNGDILVADAIVKRLTAIDYQTAYEALVKNAEEEPEYPLFEGRGGIAEYNQLGYVSLDHERSGTRTVEYAYNDFCIATVAEALGRSDDYEKYLERSKNWANLWDDETRSVRPRHADGSWLGDFDPAHNYPDDDYSDFEAPFYEGNGYQYSTFVPHDVQGLIDRLGGDEGFLEWLDKLFDRGGYTHTNEPDILASYLYIHAGRPDRTAERVRYLLAEQYSTGRSGLPGNDDSGTMSSWYVWGAIGLYPNAGQPYYYIGSPIFTRASISLGDGRSFTVEAPDTSETNLYVQSASLDGETLDRAWLHHEEIARGARLILRMGESPLGWGRDNRPPSVSTKSAETDHS